MFTQSLEKSDIKPKKQNLPKLSFPGGTRMPAGRGERGQRLGRRTGLSAHQESGFASKAHPRLYKQAGMRYTYRFDER